ncbi:IgGFc-binding protein [Zonotrichia albicollis]|uniref:IgGFc-binding protein n=1 Tax=Zonotrichia albicollis TaxID=44394 RepID=UPI003D80CE18
MRAAAQRQARARGWPPARSPERRRPRSTSGRAGSAPARARPPPAAPRSARPPAGGSAAQLSTAQLSGGCPRRPGRGGVPAAGVTAGGSCPYTCTTNTYTNRTYTSSSDSIHGDPHYTTFDKQRHDFMGTCTYTLSKLCDSNSSLPYFNVEAANEHRGGNTRVSYVQYVDVDVYGYRINLGQKRAVKVNGVSQVVPVTLVPGVSISLSGQYVVVTTDFGLQVKFDGNHRAEITLPSTYMSKVCGICGNYNGQKADDFLNPDGEMEANSTSLGNSWQVYNDSRCSPDYGHTPNCTDEEKHMIQSNAYCGLITDPSGPFQNCHAVVDPRSYFEDCQYDLSLACAANSHYEPCAAACPATCVDPTAPYNCSLPCVEGCVCDSGYLLYNDRCVPSQQCGCWHNGQHYPVGSEFWTDNTCSYKCTCPSRGSKVQCFNASCPASQYCGVQNGKPVCLEHSYGICHVHGDPHYQTFDKVTHNFMGNCTYTLAKVCSNTTSLPYFNVEAKNEHRGSTRVSYVREVVVEVYGQRIVIVKQQMSHVLVNNVRQTLPVSAAGGAITVSRSGRYIVLETDFSLRVSYDADHSVEVKVPTTYFNLTCGMCGNFNNRRDDEYMMPNGQQAADSNALGESWQVPDSDPSCGVPVPSPPCSDEDEKLYGSDQFCGILTSRPSPFESCHGVINPQDYFDTCLYDLCALNGGQEFLCAALEAYADACQAAGVTLLPWRNATFCQGCECNSGFVLSGGHCVSMSNCGCLQNVCSSDTCEASEVCKVQNGLLGCYPLNPSTCHIFGDPHYITFDGRLYNFMGTCTYTLSKLCDSNSSLPYFNVEAANEHRGGNTRVSYVRYVDVDVADLRIRLGQGGVVTVNGVEEILPCSPSEGVQVLSSGLYTMVMTDFGLRVKFDGNHRVEVTLPSSFGQKVCGMCGNYNGIAADDFQNPEGTMEPDSTSLGNSWEVSNNSSCSAGPLPTPACNETDKQLISSSHFCGLLNDTSGPFQVCHAVLSPSSYFDTCSYDLCELGLDRETLCKSLQSYADACQSLGVQIPAWRNATFCPIACPANSHYEPCAAACPATCVDPMAPVTCSLPCVEGCVCDSGYLLYNDRCVPSQQCGCWHNGQHYPVGSEFWTDNTCSSKCTCPSRGSKVQCFNASCPAGQYCGVQNGKPVCLEHSYGICHVHGDPHYQTFDKVTHNFMGNCTYTLAKVCSNTTSLPYFNVEAKNEHRGSTWVSYVREVVVEVYGQRIVIVKQQMSHVLVNNVRQTLPVSAAGGAITVSRSGRYIVLETDFSLRVSYDADHSVEVKVPTTYFNLTCGMCGNFNNRRDDEYMMPNGQQAADSNALGESWQVPDSDPSCGVPVPSPPCSDEDEKLYGSDQFCGILTSRPSPFESCHGVINPQDYFDTCLYDLCALNGGQEFLCAALEAYADACQAAGVTLLPWRNATFCPLQCPPNSYYDSCMTGCPATCVDQHAPQNCSKPCVEGCACSSGFLLSGDTCVPEANCGCHFEGNYYTQGESFVNENCTRQCRCEAKGQMVCSALSCGEDEVCKIQDGQRGCYPASTAVCHIYGDPHYSTFDGKLHHFQGSCNYTVVTGCDNSSVGFSITTRNEHRGSQSWTALNSVALSLEGLHIALRQHKAVYINGALVSLPASPAPGVTISLSGSYVRVSTKLGLQLQFNGDHELLVKVSEKYKDKLCGLCGTYTGSQQDDFMRPDGVVVPDFNDFGTSWRVPDDEWPHYNATSTYNNATIAWNEHRRQRGGFSNSAEPYGYYIFLQGSADTLPGFVARLVSPECSWEGTLCFRFWYHMYGTAQTMALRVYLQKGEELVEIWQETGNHGDRWYLGEVTVNTTGNFQILLDGEWGEDVRSNIALDDLSIVHGACAGTCVVEGDPHYHTFDKQLHNFMGTCTYTLSKLCDSNSSLPYFNVEAANEHRGGNTRVSYVRYVDVDVADLRIRLGQGGVVTVNGVEEILPCSPSEGVQVLSSGLYTMVMTDFGLRVKFDGNHRVEVTLPSSFGQKVCGMCGNYNGIAADDFQNPEGTMEPDSTSLGNSWEVSNNSSCSAGPLPTPACNETDKQLISSSHFCGLLNDTSGPFQVCHAVLSPSSYFDTCSYDLCELGLDRETLCKSLQSYADACQSLGVQIPAWRNATFCPIACPANSHYEPCAAACPATCVDPTAPYNCSLPCVEGCVCDSGYLLYNDRCVPSQQCGCWHNGQHYPVGSEFWMDNTCSSKCTCPSRGSKVQCFNASCPAGQYCGVQNGKPVCLEHSYGICHVHGDPHYQTFDKVTHNFMGNCTYTLAKVCSNTTSLPYFNVEAKNEHRGSPQVSYVREVVVEVYGQRIVIVKQQMSHVLVNNVRQTLPVSAAGGAITVSRSGRYIVLETDFSLRVSYDADHSVEVKVPTTYFNLTCGMCGNFNNRRDDEYMMPNGQQAADSNALGESWQVPDSDPSCGVPVPSPPCSDEDEKLYGSDQFCGILTSRPSPFESCHGVINPQDYFDTCLYDLCALNGGQEFLCAALEAYADACQAAGVTLLPWRNATFCPLQCPPNSYYDSCMTGCPATCVDQHAPQNCSKPCVEGCACSSGFLLSGDTCVPEANCGCHFEGNYYTQGESFVNENCTRQCRCEAKGQMVCSALSCGEDEVCKIQDGQRGCYPASTAVCHIYGDPHYSTFDGKLHHFQGSCNYTVVTGCDNSSVGFSITTRNEHRGSQSWTALNSVALSLEGLHIALRQHKAVYINGALVSLPASPAPGVTISLSGSYVRVSTKLGLQLQFNGDHELLVKVSEKYKDKLCGLCGTYTGSQQDDFMRPDGVVVPDFNDFGTSWRVPDDEWPHYNATSTYNNATIAWNEHRRQRGGFSNSAEPYGYYIFLQGSADTLPGFVARLVSPECSWEGTLCFRFWYHMYGTAQTMALRVYLQKGEELVEIWQETGNHGDRWYLGEVTVNTTGNFQILLDGEWGEDVRSNIALDDLSIVHGACAGTCVVEGDPHYHTFDKQLHNFMGTCTYTLSKLCDSNSSLPYFNVEAANEHRGGNTRVSYVRYVDVDVADLRIRLGQGGVVTVNGMEEILPCSPSEGVQVLSSGLYTMVMTDFGLRVKFDGNHRVEVTLPSSFGQKVCGMCGNYNGIAADDFQNPEGTIEPDSTSLGNSWEVSNNSSCSAGPLPTPACNETDKQLISSSHFCGLLNDTSGPFQVCHAVLSPSSYFDTCSYDLCELGLDRETLCKSLQSYADACQSLGVQIPAWRNATFCPIACPANSHYEPCAAACPATCVDPTAPYNCSLPCVEGCVCDSGYLLYNDRCVPSQQCGCWHNGQHYPVGSEFWTDNTCSSKCTCPSRGSKVQCFNASCPAGQYCGVQNGKPVCLEHSYGICHVHGDPHYQTFDKVTHNFMGNCTYTLAKVCSNTTSLPYFNVEAKNEHRGSPQVSYVREVVVEVYGQRIVIVKQQMSHVLVNNVRQTLPVSAAGGAITVSRSGRYIVLETDFSLRVSYDADHSVEVKVPTTYFNLTCGMCGNFNNRRDDEYMMPNGQQAADSNALGESWQVPDSDPSCGVPVPSPPCSDEDEKLYGSDQFCGILTSRPSPFESCHGVINPQDYFDTCLYDLCALNGGQEFLCAALEAYADACQAAGVTLLPWRNATFCPLQCPPNSYYDSCMTGCPATCVDQHAPQNCSKPCVEGCACSSGFLLSGDTCVPEANCGCHFEGNYYTQGESFVNENCTRQCRCEAKGQMVCSALSCGEDEVCKIQDGQRGCYPASTAVCHIYGDPHYSTFDGKLHHFQGSCNYTVVTGCDNSSVGFSITTRNEHRGSQSWTALNSVALSLEGLHIALRQHKAVYINGALVSLPASPAPGVTISLSGSYVRVSTKLGLQLQFNGDHELLVKVSEKYKDKLCGLCGTYTGSQQDDFMRPDGVVVPDFNDFGTSWRVPDDEWPHYNATSTYNNATIAWNEHRRQRGGFSNSAEPYGYYIFLQGSADTLPGFVARLVSPECSWEGTLCFRFWYHMYGTAQTMALRVYLQKGEELVEIWQETGNHGDRWYLGEVTVNTTGNFQILLDGEWGEDVRSNIALDDLSIVHGACAGTCVVEGDPHYHTFDKQLHNFMGTCTYTLSKLCDSNSSLPYFNVEAANEHRGGNTRVSYVRYVDVDVADLRIRLGQGGVVTVNGMEEILPCSPSEGVQVLSSGLYTMVMTDFGLRVKFDGNHRVEVTLPSSFGQKVCGMCGNYNGIAADDFQNPEGTIEPDSTSLGNSWEVSNNSSCSAGPLPTPACNETDKQLISSSHFCGLLNDTSGPFQVCHAVLSPSSYFDTCSYDLCELGLDRETLCKSLQSYADACQSLGVQIPAWRNATFCPIACPANSHYEPCAAACPATCVDPTAPYNCSLPCVEGCVCDSGYLLYNDRCVPSQQCGCWHNGQHYPVGSEFWTDNTCSSKCTCPSRGSKVQCFNASCPAGQYCGVQNGKPVCLEHSYGICHVHGDPHYQTFDKVTHNFMGNCTYTLAKVCSNTTSLPYFNVEAKNEHRGSPQVSYVREVVVEVYGQRIVIVKQQMSHVLVNNVRQTLPVSAAGGAITVSRSGRYIVLETDFSLRVSYDADHSVEVKVPTTYFNLTCGMCGNFNNRRDDEYMMPNGQQAADSNALGESWQVPDSDPSCGVPVPSPPCSDEDEKLYGSDQFCGILTSRPSPFESCHGVINPQDYFDTCLYDLCALNGGQEFLCAALEAYADACQAAGVTLLPWRNATFCPLQCPPNSYYDSCMTGCPATCVDQHAPQNCSKPCVEGCACSSGFLLSGDTCVPEANCGCHFEGNYYTQGESFVNENCTRQCRCEAKGQMVCSALSCGEDEVCKIQDGQRGCYPASTAVCHIYGDPHYSTFDGKLHHFQGSCNYTVVTGCDNSSVGFSITTRNEHRGSQSWTALNSVALSLEGLHIALRQHKAVYINGALVSLPASPAPGVTISLSGSYVRVSTKLGLQLQFNGDHELLVKVSEKYKDKLCGLCGTYTGSQQDDFMRPDGVVVPDFNDFGTSWRVPDDEWPHYNATSTYNNATIAWNEHRRQRGGFSNSAEPYGYYIFLQGSADTLPGFVARLVSPECSWEGTLCFRFWYHMYGTAQTMALRVYLQKGEELVEIWQETGNHGDRWYLGEVTVNTTGNFQILLDGEWGEDVRSNIALDDLSIVHGACAGTCVVEGDPHYHTFDKQLHNFMGTCTYTLSKLCDSNSSLPSFNVQVANELLILNNERVYTPVQNRLQGVTIGNIGRFIVVETDFGVIVKFDGNHHLEITLPRSYFSQVHGMCGNFNGNLEDDLSLTNGTTVTAPQFGNSWEVEKDSDKGCLPDLREDDEPPCTAENKQVIERQCNVLKSDKFKVCHSLVNPDDFIEICVYDMCQYDGMKSALCDIVQVYVDTCKNHGITIKWRNSTFCPLPCPSRSHYKDCVSPCPSTCSDIFASSLCENTEECTEGCECDDNYVLSNGNCVPLSSCGCRDDDNNYYSAGETWLTPHCTQRCQCQKNGVISCRSYSCDSRETCVIKNGKHKCNPTSFGICQVMGDPHYITFDKLVHHFQGKYTYILAQTTPDLPDTLTQFSIEGMNYPLLGSRHITYLKEMLINVYNHTVRFRHNKQILLDGVRVRPPVRPHEGIRIYQRLTRIYLETDFGLYVSFDGIQNADIKLATTYRSRVEGLCGDFDGRYRNDFKNPHGVSVRNVNTFGESWKVPLKRSSRLRRDVNSENEPEEEPDTGLFQGCNENQLEQQNTTSKCQILTNLNGPFAKCHSAVQPDFYFTSCLFDSCVEGDEILCQSLEEYVLACQQQGVSMDGWRQQTDCGMSCPPNSKYSSCMSACPASCNDLTSPSECESPCVEGCECLPGYVLSGLECVPYKQCGCTYLNKYYEIGEIFTTDDCSQKCQCTESSTVFCSDEVCGSGEICDISNYTRGCYRSGPCMPNPCKNDGICSETSNSTSLHFCECSELYTGLNCEAEKIAEDPGTEDSDYTVAIVIGVVAGVVVIVILISSAVYLFRTKRNVDTVVITRDSSLKGSRDKLDARVREQDYGCIVNSAFDQNESSNAHL